MLSMIKQTQKYSGTFLFALLLFTAQAKAQLPDTLHLSLPEAEKIFLQKNLSLLASKYSIDANKVLIKQAKLWDNPILNTDQNIYDGKFFQHNTNAGQAYVQIMQLIKTAGKRSKAAQLAMDNTTLSQEQFDELLRSLRYTLRSDLLEVNHLLKIKKIYDAEINEVNDLVKGMDLQLQVGNVSAKDNLRVKALLFSLQNELVNIETQLMPVESELLLLLGQDSTVFIAPKLVYKFGELTTVIIPGVDSLVKQAEQSRPDIKIAQTQLDLQNHNLNYQKALAKPDVSVGVEYDRRNSYNPNYFGLAISLPLNIINRNQGNIAAAKFGVQQQQVIVDQSHSRIYNEVNLVEEKVKYYQRANNRDQLDFSQKYDAIFSGMLKSYKERQLSLLEFIDFMDAYKDTKLKLLEQHNSLIKAFEELNYTTNSNIISIQ